MYDLSIFDLVDELKSYITSPIVLPSGLNITTSNSKALRDLVSDWASGVYDNDLEAIESEILSIFNQ